MGQKVNPYGFRVGPTLIKNWDSIFYADRTYSELLLQDINIRKSVNMDCAQAQVSRVFIERSAGKVTVNVYARKPGVIIGKSGSDIDKLKKEIQKIVSTDEVYINIHEIKKPNLDACIVAQNIAAQLSKRGSFKKAMKTALQSAMKQGARGIKVSCSGRLGGQEIARTEWYMEGSVPLHTLKANIDYALSKAKTTYGVIGVKVWIYRVDQVQNKKEYLHKSN